MIAPTTQPPDPGAPLVQMQGIRKSFGGVEVLHDVGLSIEAGRVLALLGENGAGKSTLMKILAGDYGPDAGTIRVGEAVRTRLDAYGARALGIRMIFQELSVAPALTVAENVFLGRWPSRFGRVLWSTMRRRAREVIADLGVDLDPDALVGDLEVGQRQIVEIARAVSDAAKVLVLDEPTAALSDHEASRLFEIVRRMKAQGVAIIYITHRLDEVALVADHVQVLRDGRSVLALPVAGLSKREIVAAMIGRKVGEISRPAGAPDVGPVALTITSATGDGFRNVSLALHEGEVVALYGKLGSGTAAVVEALYGLRVVTDGTIVVGDRGQVPSTPAEAITAGFGLVPADRKGEGGFAVRSASENLAAPSWPKMALRLGILPTGPEVAAYRRWQERLSIAGLGGPGQAFATFSGGNQQKVVIARWFERGARKLLMIEPTRGVDVGARAEIYASIRRSAEEGTAVLIATSDYEEVIQVADRAMVLARGEVVAELAGDEVTGEALLTAAGG